MLKTRFSGVYALFQGRDFRRLCGAQLLGGLGEWLATLALMALVWDRTRSAFISGIVLALRILPAALIGGLLSSIVDRLDRRRVLIACTAARGCIYGTLPLVGGIAPVLALALIAEIATLAFVAARDATLPRLVPADKLPTANAIAMGSAFGSMPFGSGLFAGMTALQAAVWRPGVTFALLAASTLLWSATLLIGRIAAAAGVSPVRESVAVTGEKPRLRGVLAADPVLRRVVLGGTIAACAGGSLLTLGLGYVRETLQASSGAYAGLLTAFCFGAVAGLGALHRARTQLSKLFHLGVGTMGAILLSMALFPSTIVGFAMSFGFGAAFVATFLGGVTILQDRVHDSVRGRMFAIAHCGLRVGAVAVGLVAAWGAHRLGAASVIWTLDGTQIVLGAAGLALLLAGAVHLRPFARTAV